MATSRKLIISTKTRSERKENRIRKRGKRMRTERKVRKERWGRKDEGSKLGVRPSVSHFLQ